jgi:ribosome-binding protein aMBF1 (putative translation factor)
MTPRGENERAGRGRALDRLRERVAHAEDGWFFAQIAGQVADRRRELGLSQAELAMLCDTTQSAIARLESGGRPPRIDTLLRIANALDCELAVELRPRTRSRKEGGRGHDAR